jgi:hypothetical protein
MIQELKKMFLVIATFFTFLIPTFSYCQQVYDHSINNTVFERSEYYTKNQTHKSYDSFLTEVNTSTKIFVHFAGCGGITPADHKTKSHYFLFDGAVIFINFLKRPGVKSSCPGGKFADTSEVSNINRLDLRRKEAEVLVLDLKSKGYNNIYVSGHSEGGRVASTWTMPVKGVIIHGCDCKLHWFWNIQRNQKTIVMFNWKDDWLTAKREVASCQHFFNRGWVTEVNTDEISHIPFSNALFVEEFQKWLINTL